MLRVLDGIDRILVYLSGISLFIMMLLVFANAMLRFTVNSPISGVIEFTGEYLMVIIVYLSLSFTHKNGGHVSVNVVVDKLPPKLHGFLSLIINLIAFSILSLLSYSAFNMYLDYLSSNIRSISSLEYPLSFAVLLIFVGTLILCIRLLINFFINCKELFSN